MTPWGPALEAHIGLILRWYVTADGPHVGVLRFRGVALGELGPRRRRGRPRIM